MINSPLIVPRLMFLYNDLNDSERIRFVLTSTGYVYLKQDFSKHLRNLRPASRAILLSGPAGILLTSSVLPSKIYFGFQIHTIDINCLLNFEEPYQQNLARALAHYFESKLLLLDITDFSLEVVIYILSLCLL